MGVWPLGRRFGRMALTALGALMLGFGGMVGADSVPDFDREARIAEQIEPGIFDGEPVWLNAGEQEFLGIFIEVEEPKGNVVLMQGLPRTYGVGVTYAFGE